MKISTIVLICLASFCCFVLAKENSSNESSPDELHRAVEQDDVAAVEEILKRDFEGKLMAAIVNASGFTLLHVAARFGSLKTVEYYFEQSAAGNNKSGEELRRTNKHLETPLHLACLGGHLEVVDFFIKKGQELRDELIEAESTEKMTPLFYASRSGSPHSQAVVDLLIRNNANLLHEDFNGRLAAHHAVIDKRFELAKQLLKSNQAAGKSSTTGRTLTHIAAEFDLAADFLTEMADHLNWTATDNFGMTPSCVAAFYGSVNFGEAMAREKLSPQDGKCVYRNDSSASVTAVVSGTPLHLAAFNRQKRYVELLIQLNANVLGQDQNGGTALHVMASSAAPVHITADDEDSSDLDESAIIEMLWRRNKRIIESVDFKGRTPFLMAAMASSRRFAEKLRLKFGANPSAVDRRGFSALHLARTSTFVDYLLRLPNLFVNVNRKTFAAVSSSGLDLLTSLATPLMVATAERKPIELISFLISHGADKNSQNERGMSAVHVAVDVGYLDAIDVFLLHSFDLTIRDRAGRTALSQSIDQGKLEIAKLIIASSAGNYDEKQQAEIDDTPLHVAARSNILEIAQLLLEKGANISAVNKEARRTPLHEAVVNSHPEMVQLLIQQGAPLTARDNFGRTPIHLASPCNALGLEIVSKLLPVSSGNNNSNEDALEVMDDFGETPLTSAVKNNCFDFVSYFLLNSNANCSQMNGDGLTPLHLAQQLGFDKLKLLLLNTGKCSMQQVDSCGNTVQAYEARNKSFSCGKLPDVDRGTIETGSSCVGSNATIRCDQKCAIIGQENVRCDDNGRWIVAGHCTKILPRDCEEIAQYWPDSPSGVYSIYVKLDDNMDSAEREEVKVYCEMKLLGGGYTVFQKRVNDGVSFYQKWASYKAGFGNLNGSYWLGNRIVRQMTYSAGSNYALVVALSSTSSSIRSDAELGFAFYDTFYLKDESNKYQLQFSQLVCKSNTIVDGLSALKGQAFATADYDSNGHNCAERHKSGWWHYPGCGVSNLNGIYGSTPDNCHSIFWNSHSIANYGSQICQPKFQSTMMMIRRKRPNLC